MFNVFVLNASETHISNHRLICNFALAVLRIVLTWFPAANNAPLARPLITVCDPYLNLFRNVVPPLFGAIDLSPVLALILLQAFGSASVALGAEMPGNGASTGRGIVPRSRIKQMGPWGAMVRSLRERRK